MNKLALFVAADGVVMACVLSGRLPIIAVTVAWGFGLLASVERARLVAELDAAGRAGTFNGEVSP